MTMRSHELTKRDMSPQSSPGSRTDYTPRKSRLPKFNFQIIPYDFWIGAYWNEKSRTLFLCPVPCCVYSFQWPGGKTDFNILKELEDFCNNRIDGMGVTMDTYSHTNPMLGGLLMRTGELETMIRKIKEMREELQ